MKRKEPLPLTLVIAPADGPARLPELEVLGLRLGDHVPVALRKLRDLHVLPLSRSALHPDRDGERLDEGRELLISEADVWFSPAAMERLLVVASGAEKPLKVVSRTRVRGDPRRRKDVLAIHFPPAAASSFIRKQGIERARGGLRELSRSLRGVREITADELDSEQPARRLQGLDDVSNLEKEVSCSRAHAAMMRGVRIRDPGSITIRGELHCGERVEIDVNVIIEGRVSLGDDVRIGPNSVIIDATIGPRSRVHAFSIVERAQVGADTFVGPYGRLRPGSVIGDSVQVGNFVEIKNSDVGSRSRINHLTFVGDSTVGERVTVGAGTITCNHNRLGPARTTIGNGAYIGSGTELVAPVSIGADATIGAGSTITADAPAGKLTIARAKQVTVDRWKPPSQNTGEGG